MVTTPVGESVVAKRVYRNCPIMFPNRITYVELEMVDFDVILGMDWSHDCFATIDCKRRVVKFNFPNKLVLGQIISCFKSCKMISKVCLYHIVRVKDLDSEIPPFEKVPK